MNIKKLNRRLEQARKKYEKLLLQKRAILRTNLFIVHLSDEELEEAVKKYEQADYINGNRKAIELLKKIEAEEGEAEHGD